MKKSILFSLGVVSVIGISGASIYLSVTPKTNCVDEILEVTNAENVPVAALLAPESILYILRPLVLKTTSIEKIDNVVVAAGVIPHESGSSTIIMKVLIDVNTPKNDSVFKEVDSAFYQQAHQCRIGGKNYKIYTGKTLMNLE